MSEKEADIPKTLWVQMEFQHATNFAGLNQDEIAVVLGAVLEVKFAGLCVLSVVMLQIGCATPSRFHAAYLPPDSLILVQIRGFDTQQEILGIPMLVNTLELSGTPRSRIKDGMVADGRTFCCGGPNKSNFDFWFYVPEGVDAEVGDIVEVKMGAMVLNNDPIRVPPNTMQQVHSKLESVGEECRWVPDNPRLWGLKFPIRPMNRSFPRFL